MAREAFGGLILAIVTIVIVVTAAAIWFLGPGLAVAGQALDNPSWSSDPDGPAGQGADVETSTSWWPPGTRYEWIGKVSGEPRSTVDPWSSEPVGHLDSFLRSRGGHRLPPGGQLLHTRHATTISHPTPGSLRLTVQDPASILVTPLQIRTRVLDHELDNDIARWHPNQPIAA